MFRRKNPFEPVRDGGRIYIFSPHVLGLDTQMQYMASLPVGVVLEDPKWYRYSFIEKSVDEISEDEAVDHKPEEGSLALSVPIPDGQDVNLEHVQLQSTLAILGCPSTQSSHK